MSDNEQQNFDTLKETAMNKATVAKAGLFAALGTLNMARLKTVGRWAIDNRGDIALAVGGLLLADISASTEMAEDLGMLSLFELDQHGIIDLTD